MGHISQSQKAILDQFPSFPADGDYVLRIQNGALSWEEGLGAAGSLEKLWEWNGADVSQFEASADFNGSTVTAMGAPALSVVADATVPGGNVLRLTAGGSPAGYAAAHWLVKAAESTLTYPGRYRWEWALRAAQPLYGGLSFLANPATDHYYGINVLTNNGSRHRIDAGTVIDFLAGGTNSNLSSSASQDSTGWIEAWIETRGAAPPRFEISGFGVTGQSAPLGFNHADSGTNDGTWQTSGTQPPSSWHGLAADRWGLSLVSQSGQAAGNMDLSRLALYRVGGAGASDTDAHDALDTLVHKIAETSYSEPTYVGGDITKIETWTSASKTTLVRDQTFTYTAGEITTVVTRQYNSQGAVVQTLTENLTYTGGDWADTTRTRS